VSGFSSVKAGDPLVISASEWRRIGAAVEAFERSRSSFASGPILEALEPDLVMIRNDTGDDLPRFGVVGLGVALIDPDDSEAGFLASRALEGELATALHGSRLAVALAPIRDGAIGPAAASGVVPVRISVAGDSDHGAARLKIGEAGFLEAHPAGSAAVLWREGGTGEQWAIVRLGSAPVAVVAYVGSGGISAASEASGVLTPGSGSATVYYRSSATQWTRDTGATFTIYNTQAETISGSIRIQTKPIGGELWVDVEACPA
jgi:hypothetical protein